MIKDQTVLEKAKIMTPKQRKKWSFQAEEKTFSTPKIPCEIRKIRLDGYKNIYDWDLGNKNLWGTESLMGDWAGEHLIIAKDFYPSEYIDLRKSISPETAYHHAPIQTNTKLINFLTYHEVFDTKKENISNNFMYISICFLIKLGSEPSTKICNTALYESKPAVQFTIDNMPNLKKIITLGDHARDGFNNNGLKNRYEEKYKIYNLKHPRWGSNEHHIQAWANVFR